MADDARDCLTGRTTPGIERVGATVVRPAGAHSAFVHALLRHLEARSFSGAPKWLGHDATGREILTYVPGEVPSDLGPFSAEQVAAAARLLRALHDATVDFSDRDGHEVVCHGDASPCNCVFQDGRPIAFIDFDAAHAGDRRDDVGYAAWLWLDIGNEELDPIQQGRRVGDFVAAYGRIGIDDALPAILDAQAALSMRPGAPLATREWAARCLRWSSAHRAALATGLASVVATSDHDGRMSLGLESGTVRVVPYDPEWPRLFAAEAGRLQEPFTQAGLTIRIEHAGSTSVPGLAAKPILDVVAGYPPGADAGAYIAVLVQAGYMHRGENGIPGREFFRRGDPRAYHVHLVAIGGTFWRDHLAFPACLRASDVLRDAYAALKRELAARHPRDREAYTDAKGAFVQAVLASSPVDPPISDTR